MPPDAELESLMVRYQQGDLSAASELVARLSPALHRFFMVQFVSRRYADDLLQETWLRIHEVRHTYRPGEPVLPWLYAIARHIRVDQYRKTRRVETREQQVERLPDTPTVDRASGVDIDRVARQSAGEPARSGGDVESLRYVARRSGACDIVERGIGKAEGASRV